MTPVQKSFNRFFVESPLASSQMSFLYEENGFEVASYKPDDLLIPASNTKLIHTALALFLDQDKSLFPPLRVLTNGPVSDGVLNGDLILDSCGSLLFSSRYPADHSIEQKNVVLNQQLKDFVEKLKGLGIRTVEGDLLLSFERWQGLLENSHYNAATPFAYNENTVDTHVQGGWLKTCPEKPLMFHFKQDSTLKLQSKGADNTIAYNSAVPNRDYWRISKTDANEYARLMVKRQLEKEGIVFVEKKIKSSEKKLLLEIKALETIEEYIRPVNTYSDNFRAELLALQLNRCLSGKATYADLSENLSKYQPKILPAGIQIFDGSGLSRKNRLSAKILVRLLDTMSHSDVHHHFERSLAVAGKTGTLKNRFKGSAFEGRFLGKTGTLDKVTALSGYWFKDDATSVKLSFIGNGADNKLYWQALESFAKSL